MWTKELKDGSTVAGCRDCANRGRRGGVAKFAKGQSANLTAYKERHAKHN